MPNWPALYYWVDHHDPIARPVEVRKQLVLVAELACDVVLETRATITRYLKCVARHLALGELSIICKIGVCHND